MQPSIRHPEEQSINNKKVSDVIVDKRRLVEVPYTASLADSLNTLMASKVAAVPVAAPPGHWIGAGGSMILEADRQTGSVRKHYIGMLTMLDILAHIAGDSDSSAEIRDLEKKMAVPVSSIIGYCLEGLSLWTLHPNTSVLDCMEVFSKGIHRALVPVDGQGESTAGVELSESASSYLMMTQMDVLRFLRTLDDQELAKVMSRSVKEVGGVVEIIFGVSEKAKVTNAIKNMRTASLAAVPILESSNDVAEDHNQLINARGRKLKGTFSATDLRGCPIAQLQSLLSLGVLEFIEKLSSTAFHEASGLRNSYREAVTCHEDSPLGEVVEKAVSNHVHRIWVVDQHHQSMLIGVVSLTDMIRVIRACLISDPPM